MLLHGYMSKKESFYYQTEFFSKHFQVIAPDFPGFGASAPADIPFSVGDYADWLFRFLSELKVENCNIIAHSFGARVAFKLLSERPRLCKNLVITGGAGIVKPRSPRYIRRVNAYRKVKKLFPRFAEKHFGSSEYRTLSPLQRESYKKIVNEDLSACASKIWCRTLLIYGRDDTVTPPREEGETFNRLIEGSRLKVIEGTHFCFCENADLFNKLVFNFLTEE